MEPEQVSRQPQRLAYSVREVVEMVPLSRAALYEEISAGRLRSKVYGRRRLVTPSDLQEWLDALPDFHPTQRAS